MSLSLLNLGCGSFIHDEWTNVDFVSRDRRVIAHNLLQGIPFDANTFDAVYHSHVLEHFPKNKALFFLQECNRVLKSGGWLRVVVPDLEGICREYLKWLEPACHGDENARKNYEWIVVEMLDQLVRNQSGGEMAPCLTSADQLNPGYIEERIGIDVTEGWLSTLPQKIRTSEKLKNKCIALCRCVLGKHFDYYVLGKFKMGGEMHQWMYDRYSLPQLLSAAGFDTIEIKTAYDSNILNYEKYSLDTYQGKARGASSLFIEAQKP
jgi:SAM-dependent methyltransferase